MVSVESSSRRACWSGSCCVSQQRGVAAAATIRDTGRCPLPADARRGARQAASRDYASSPAHLGRPGAQLAVIEAQKVLPATTALRGQQQRGSGRGCRSARAHLERQSSPQSTATFPDLLPRLDAPACCPCCSQGRWRSATTSWRRAAAPARPGARPPARRHRGSRAVGAAGRLRARSPPAPLRAGGACRTAAAAHHTRRRPRTHLGAPERAQRHDWAACGARCDGETVLACLDALGAGCWPAAAPWRELSNVAELQARLRLLPGPQLHADWLAGSC